ncbi:hypothetical protein PFISCL1PPCAC_23114, partial [Pristionchus fissidentatus]
IECAAEIADPEYLSAIPTMFFELFRVYNDQFKRELWITRENMTEEEIEIVRDNLPLCDIRLRGLTEMTYQPF